MHELIYKIIHIYCMLAIFKHTSVSIFDVFVLSSVGQQVWLISVMITLKLDGEGTVRSNVLGCSSWHWQSEDWHEMSTHERSECCWL